MRNLLLQNGNKMYPNKPLYIINWFRQCIDTVILSNDYSVTQSMGHIKLVLLWFMKSWPLPCKFNVIGVNTKWCRLELAFKCKSIIFPIVLSLIFHIDERCAINRDIFTFHAICECKSANCTWAKNIILLLLCPLGPITDMCTGRNYWSFLWLCIRGAYVSIDYNFVLIDFSKIMLLQIF